MSNVASLRGLPVANQPNEDLITELERLLQEARDGKIVAMAYATCIVSGGYGSGWTSQPDGHSLGTGIIGLMHRFGAAAWD